MDEHKHLEILAMCVHVAIAVLCLLALLHNVRKRNWKQASVCIAMLAYEAQAILVHFRDLRGGGRDT